MKVKIILFILSFMFLPLMVNASTYLTTNDLFETSYSNNLIDMANTQIENFTSKNYAIIQIDYNYYLISANKKDVSVSGNVISMENTVIISAIRNQSGYNTYYSYNTSNEAKTIIYANNIIVSNIETPKSISSKRYHDYMYDKNFIYMLIFILAITFATFLTKERNY